MGRLPTRNAQRVFGRRFREVSMIRLSIPSTVLFMTVAVACNSASNEQKTMSSTRADADDKSGAAVKEANQKIRNAQQEAGKKVAAAHAGFMKLREEYRHTTTMNLIDLYHKVDDLEAKAKHSSGKARAELDANLKQIRTNRGAFETDYKSLDTATASTWDDAKAHLDKEWTLLKTLVDKA
jgi:hypothetical protein